ncbi:MAG: DUF2752 domain-containing protein [Phycisphaerae bacterium]|nr:DUF2752 domain-containing protein [Phycisphaerae bacterium]
MPDADRPGDGATGSAGFRAERGGGDSAAEIAGASAVSDADAELRWQAYLRRERRRNRWIAAAVLLGATALLGVSARLKPDQRGFGTHQQLGFAPCGVLVRTGFPCPTCGMTTAFANTMRGRFLAAAAAQPGGLALALLTAAGAAIAAWTLVRGEPPRRLGWLLQPHVIFWALLIILLGSWVFKMFAGLATGEYPMRSVMVK